jgi:hypothetical protein
VRSVTPESQLPGKYDSGVSSRSFRKWSETARNLADPCGW